MQYWALGQKFIERSAFTIYLVIVVVILFCAIALFMSMFVADRTEQLGWSVELVTSTPKSTKSGSRKWHWEQCSSNLKQSNATPPIYILCPIISFSYKSASSKTKFAFRLIYAALTYSRQFLSEYIFISRECCWFHQLYLQILVSKVAVASISKSSDVELQF